MLGAEDLLVLALPALLVITMIRVLRRRQGVGRIMSTGLLGLYGVFFVSVTLFPVPVSEAYIDLLRRSGERSVHNLVPGRTIMSALEVAPDVFVYQIGGNLLLTLPLGALLPVLWQRCHGWRGVVAAGLPIVVGIETVQLVASQALGVTYKSFDVDDLLLNTVGLALGWSLWRVTQAWLGHRSDWRELIEWLRGAGNRRPQRQPDGSARSTSGSSAARGVR